MPRFGRRTLNSSRVPLRTVVLFFNDDHLSDYLSALSSRPKQNREKEEEGKGKKRKKKTRKQHTRNRNRNKEETYRTIGSSTRRNASAGQRKRFRYLLEISITGDECTFNYPCYSAPIPVPKVFPFKLQPYRRDWTARAGVGEGGRGPNPRWRVNLPALQLCSPLDGCEQRVHPPDETRFAPTMIIIIGCQWLVTVTVVPESVKLNLNLARFRRFRPTESPEFCGGGGWGGWGGGGTCEQTRKIRGEGREREESRGGFIEKRTRTPSSSKPSKSYIVETRWSFRDWTIITTYSVRRTGDKYY